MPATTSQPDSNDFDSREPKTTRNRTFSFNIIKARIAETIIEELFLTSNYKVFRYGMENTIPGIVHLLKDQHSEVAMNIKRMPDFVVQDPKTKEVYFIEVKFRANGRFEYNDLKDDYPYLHTFVILVSKTDIKCLSAGELKQGKCFSPSCDNHLGTRKEFKFDSQVIAEFCGFASKFLGKV